MIITSTANALVKQLVQYKKKKKERDKAGLYLVEGKRMYEEIPPEDLLKTYVSESFYKKEKIAGTVLSDEVFHYVSDTKTPQGILCLVKQKKHKKEEVLKGEKKLLLLLENIQDPGNLGTIIRSAEAAGVSGVVISKESADIYNPKVIRSTMGSIFRVPFYYEEDMLALVRELKKEQVKTFAAHLEGSKNHEQGNYLGSCGFLIGNEGNGLSANLTKEADELIKIPMAGAVESLNAAISATLLIFEAARQRRQL